MPPCAQRPLGAGRRRARRRRAGRPGRRSSETMMLAPSEPPELSRTVSPSGPNTSVKLFVLRQPALLGDGRRPGSSRSSTPRNAVPADVGAVGGARCRRRRPPRAGTSPRSPPRRRSGRSRARPRRPPSRPRRRPPGRCGCGAGWRRGRRSAAPAAAGRTACASTARTTGTSRIIPSTAGMALAAMTNSPPAPDVAPYAEPAMPTPSSTRPSSGDLRDGARSPRRPASTATTSCREAS